PRRPPPHPRPPPQVRARPHAELTAPAPVGQAAEQGDGRVADRLAPPLPVQTRAREVARGGERVRREEVAVVVVGPPRDQHAREAPPRRRLDVLAEPRLE